MKPVVFFVKILEDLSFHRVRVLISWGANGFFLGSVEFLGAQFRGNRVREIFQGVILEIGKLAFVAAKFFLEKTAFRNIERRGGKLGGRRADFVAKEVGFGFRLFDRRHFKAHRCEVYACQNSIKMRICQSMKALPRILCIVGPTASGKSALAYRLAKTLGGEIVSADSRLLYQGMDIGTAKPTKEERRHVPHHMIDIVPPAKTLTLSEYKRRALRAIRGVLRRGRVPIVVGGTGLYVRTLVENLEIPEVPPNERYREFLRKKGTAWILERVEKLDPEYAKRIGPNPRFATRALEVMKATGKPFSSLQGKGPQLFDVHLIGLLPAPRALKRRIGARVNAMFREGLEEEASLLAKKFDTALPSMSGIGYRELWPYFRGECSLAEAKKAIARNTEQYAKRQMTWWRGMKGIEWFSAPEAALRSAKKWLYSAK